jgi:hypothetical protein
MQLVKDIIPVLVNVCNSFTKLDANHIRIPIEVHCIVTADDLTIIIIQMVSVVSCGRILVDLARRWQCPALMIVRVSTNQQLEFQILPSI